ncbi:unnamed protein product [Closterium sp. NIES-64]|nr:unnamed protein product [Closterium sp. NIES-64]
MRERTAFAMAGVSTSSSSAVAISSAFLLITACIPRPVASVTMTTNDKDALLAIKPALGVTLTSWQASSSCGPLGFVQQANEFGAVSCDGSGNVVWMNFHMQSLKGSMPTDISKLSALTFLNLCYNLLRAPPPSPPPAFSISATTCCTARQLLTHLKLPPPLPPFPLPPSPQQSLLQPAARQLHALDRHTDANASTHRFDPPPVLSLPLSLPFVGMPLCASGVSNLAVRVACRPTSLCTRVHTTIRFHSTIVTTLEGRSRLDLQADLCQLVLRHCPNIQLTIFSNYLVGTIPPLPPSLVNVYVDENFFIARSPSGVSPAVCHTNCFTSSPPAACPLSTQRPAAQCVFCGGAAGATGMCGGLLEGCTVDPTGLTAPNGGSAALLPQFCEAVYILPAQVSVLMALKSSLGVTDSTWVGTGECTGAKASQATPYWAGVRCSGNALCACKAPLGHFTPPSHRSRRSPPCTYGPASRSLLDTSQKALLYPSHRSQRSPPCTYGPAAPSRHPFNAHLTHSHAYGTPLTHHITPTLFLPCPCSPLAATPASHCLDLSSNLFNQQLDGFLSDVYSLTQLKQLLLGYNWFYGSVPTTISQLSKLTGLSLFSNYLTGSLPSLPSSLLALDIAYNFLSGSLPTLPSTLSHCAAEHNCLVPAAAAPCARFGSTQRPAAVAGAAAATATERCAVCGMGTATEESVCFDGECVVSVAPAVVLAGPNGPVQAVQDLQCTGGYVRVGEGERSFDGECVVSVAPAVVLAGPNGPVQAVQDLQCTGGYVRVGEGERSFDGERVVSVAPALRWGQTGRLKPCRICSAQVGMSVWEKERGAGTGTAWCLCLQMRFSRYHWWFTRGRVKLCWITMFGCSGVCAVCAPYLLPHASTSSPSPCIHLIPFPCIHLVPFPMHPPHPLPHASTSSPSPCIHLISFPMHPPHPLPHASTSSPSPCIHLISFPMHPPHPLPHASTSSPSPCIHLVPFPMHPPHPFPMHPPHLLPHASTSSPSPCIHLIPFPMHPPHLLPHASTSSPSPCIHLISFPMHPPHPLPHASTSSPSPCIHLIPFPMHPPHPLPHASTSSPSPCIHLISFPMHPPHPLPHASTSSPSPCIHLIPFPMHPPHPLPHASTSSPSPCIHLIPFPMHPPRPLPHASTSSPSPCIHLIPFILFSTLASSPSFYPAPTHPPTSILLHAGSSQASMSVATVTALLSLKSALGVTATAWGSGGCSVEGYTSGSDWPGVACDSLGNVVSIDLTSQKLKGSMTPWQRMAALSHHPSSVLPCLSPGQSMHAHFHALMLSTLVPLLHGSDLTSQKLKGSMASDVIALTSLTRLIFDSNLFWTPLASFVSYFSSLSSLVVLDLQYNWFYGTLPAYLLDLPNLTSLALGGNYLTGTVPKPTATTLGKLTLTSNFLTGSAEQEVAGRVEVEEGERVVVGEEMGEGEVEGRVVVVEGRGEGEEGREEEGEGDRVVGREEDREGGRVGNRLGREADREGGRVGNRVGREGEREGKRVGNWEVREEDKEGGRVVGGEEGRGEGEEEERWEGRVGVMVVGEWTGEECQKAEVMGEREVGGREALLLQEARGEREEGGRVVYLEHWWGKVGVIVMRGWEEAERVRQKEGVMGGREAREAEELLLWEGRGEREEEKVGRVVSQE